VSALVVVFASRTLGLPAGAIGLALGLGAAGGLAGALLAGRVAGWLGTGRTIAVGAVVFTAPLAVLPLASGTPLARATVLAGVEAISAFGVMLFDVNLNAVMAAVIPDDLRGRVMGAFTSINYGVRPVGAALGGLLAGWLGAGAAIAVGGAGGSLAVLWLVRTAVLQIRSVDDLGPPVA
jgi:MFS family permease